MSDVEVLHHPDGTVPPQIVGMDHLPDVTATDAARHLRSYVSERSVSKYRRGAAAMMAAYQRYAAANPNSPSIWEAAPITSTLWNDVLKDLGFQPRWSSKEGCFYLTVDDAQFDRISSGLNGLTTLYQSAIDRHLYIDSRNPLESLTTISRPGRRTVKSLFRIKRDRPRTLRTQLPAIVERIRRAGASATRKWPPSVALLIDLMIEGLARLSEQIALTLKDWWDASEFGEEIYTPNKGDDYARTKVQAFSAAYAARLRRFVDIDRVDRNEVAGGARRTLDDFRQMALAGELHTLGREPIFTNAKGDFFSQSGVADYYFRPAMIEAGLDGVSSHAIRHAGVCAFFAWVKKQAVDQAEKDALKAHFGRYMGWKWPEAMLEHYGEAERRKQATDAAIQFLQARRQQLDSMAADDEPANSQFEAPVLEHNDNDLDRLAALEAA